MTVHAFARFDLRTTEPEAARRFYEMAVGLDFERDSATLAVFPLHEQARARGAPAHWLGNIGVNDLDATVRRLVELGGERLGPPVLRGPDGVPFAILRDPLGAVMAVREGARAGERGPVVWHQLHARDAERAWAIYSELFGWSATEVVSTPEVEGGHQLFAWQAGGDTVGSIANTARWPGVHVHWLFHFAVTEIDDAIAKVRANAGTVLSPFTLPNGRRIAACEDPQGAAFGLIEQRQ